jgi:hypothetical protein
MSIPIVHHVREKSQSKGSARTLLLNLAIYSNDCCGVAWPADATLRHETNVSHQRIHELKRILEKAGELVIVARPGFTNLYFVAWQGKPLGGTFPETGRHDPSCPLRYAPAPEPREGSEISETPADLGGSDISEGEGSGISEGGSQIFLSRKQRKHEKKTPVRLRRLVAIATEDSAVAPREGAPPPRCAGYPRRGEGPRYCPLHERSHFAVGGP